ncbi:MAG: hypothetical protein HKN00_13275 [Flavobacteriaceae bacterium]|nr:hypothetical protein [Bacteroidia bacterium]NNF76151.1 hypothetical protein [Flavobacteriaceae bacterium]NNK87981.1 hypothetical protein [Flavobacteriaceae bacterium]
MENRLSKYTLYAIGEIILVVIGILIALQINNQNELRKDRLLTNKYLEGFARDLASDRAQLDSLISIRKKQRTSAQALIRFIESKEFDLDSFYNHYYYIFPFYRFSPNTNTLEEVLNSSQLRLITDEDIKNRLLELRSLYTEIRLNEEHVYEDRTVYLYNERTLDHIEFNGLALALNNKSFSESKDADVYREDANYFIEDRYFKNFLNLLDFNLVYIIPSLERAQGDCDSIIDLIETNLND